MPEATCPVVADIGGMFRHPLPGEHALARAANGLIQKHGVGVRGRGPVVQDFKLGVASHKFMGANVGWLGVECRRRGNDIGFGFCGCENGRAVWNIRCNRFGLPIEEFGKI